MVKSKGVWGIGVAGMIVLLGVAVFHLQGVATSAATDRMLQNTSDGTNWASYGRTFDEGHYSPLTQINSGNVSKLGLAWASDIPTVISSVASPLAVEGVLYVTYGLSIVQAMDAATGKVRWRYDPDVAAAENRAQKGAWGVRGLAYWHGKVYVGTMDGRLIAINANDGSLAWSAQTTTLSSGLYISGPPRVFRGKVIIGNGGADFGAVRGYVTTYDAETGKELWRFYTVPGDPDKGFENEAMRMAAKTWNGQWWKQGGGGTVWNAITYDPEFNRIYIGTGNGAPWNRDLRSPGGGDNLFLCSIVALDADTGEYIWHYQTNPGESWDFNSAMDIQLATLKINGVARRVILHAPKNGFFYVIDRENGQLISAKPFVETTWASRIDLATGRPVENPEARYPTGVAQIKPGGIGAHNWQAMAFSPQTGLVYLPTNDRGGYYDARGLTPSTWKRQPGMVLDSGFNLLGKFGTSPDEPYLGTLQAWDPVRQKRVWSVPLVGPVNGGVAATGGGIILEGQADGYFVARDARNGTILWSFFAQNGIVGQPITYLAGGVQYVTILTGFSGAAAVMGPLSAKLGWDYSNQKRRILTFRLGGKVKLPVSQPSVPVLPIVDSSFALEATRADHGMEVYARHCFVCHGSGVVAGGAAPDLRASSIPLDRDSFSAVVHEGALKARGMPRFPELSTDELDALRHFIRRRAHETAGPAS